MSFISGTIRKFEQYKRMLEMKKSLVKNEDATIGAMIAMPIIAVVGIVIVLLLGSAIIPGAINTTVGIGTSSWSSGAQSMWSAVPTFAILAFFLLFVAIVLVILRAVDY